MTEYPFMCPTCGCPLQLLAAGYDGKTKGTLAAGYDGKTKGTIQDAYARHCAVVHPEEQDIDR